MIKFAIAYAILIFFLTSCAQFPAFMQAVDDIATDDGVRVEIDKAALQKDTHILVDVTNAKQP